ncbi:MAG: RHS repeat-associated core domain-containing protein [Bacteroidota bacterium]
MKKVTTALIFILLAYTVKSQENPINIQVPPAPNAAAIAQYGDIPVGEFSGTANIQVPIHTIESRAGTVPISLNYHSNGIRVNEEAGPVGLGWALSAGGVITRSIRGYDDFGSRDQGLACFGAEGAYTGYWSLVNDPNIVLPSGPVIGSTQNEAFYSDDGYVSGQPFGQNNNQVPFENGDFSDGFFCQEAGSAFDLESDLYSFNFLGYSGKFVITHDAEVRFLSANNFQVEIMGSNNNDIKWIIKTPDGFKYYFGFSNNSRQMTHQFSRSETYTDGVVSFTNNNCAIPSNPQPFSYTSSWFLDKIESPIQGSTIDEEITFEYSLDQSNPIYYPFPSYSAKEARFIEGSLIEQFGSCQPTFLPNVSETRIATFVGYDNVYLSKIIAEPVREEVIFNLSSRTDLKGGLKIDNIEVLREGGLFKKSTFTYSYFSCDLPLTSDSWTDDLSFVTSSNSGFSFIWGNNSIPNSNYSLENTQSRLKLESFHQQSTNGDGQILSYVFSYHENLPQKTSYATDAWGFYNGENDNTSFFEAILSPIGYNNLSGGTNILGIVQSGANRKANTQSVDAGLLKSLTYPTGGSSCFEFESNEYQVNDWEAGDPLNEEILVNNSSNFTGPINAPAPTDIFTVDNMHPTLPAYAVIDLGWKLADPTNQSDVCPGQTNLIPGPFHNSNPFGFKYILEKYENQQYQTVNFWQWNSPVDPSDDPYDGFLEGGGINGSDVYYSSGTFRNNTEIILENLDESAEYRLRIEPYGNPFGNNNTLPCNIEKINFKITWHAYEQINTRLGGGARIKSITNYTSTGNEAGQKTYSYKLPDGLNTSGKVFNQPVSNKIEGKYLTTSKPNQCISTTGNLILERSSSSIFSLSNSYLGNLVTYSDVKIEYPQGGYTLKSFYQKNAVSNNYAIASANIPRFSDIGNGNILTEVTFDNQNRILLEKSYSYNPDQGGSGSDLLDREDKKFDFVWNYRTAFHYDGQQTCSAQQPYQNALYSYADVPQWNYVAQITQTTFSQSSSLSTTSTTSYVYEDNHFNLRSEALSGTGGSKATTYRYATDFSGNNYQALRDAHMIGIPVEVDAPNGSTYKTKYDDTRLVPNRFLEKFADNTQIEHSKVTAWSGSYPREIRTFSLPELSTYTWDNGQLTSHTYKDHTQTWHYNNLRQMDYSIAIDGQRTDYTYDGLQRLKTISQRDGGILTEYTYAIGGGSNEISSETTYSDDEVVNTTSQTFDGLGRPLDNFVNGELQEGQRYDRYGRVSNRTFMPGRWLLGIRYERSPLNRVTQEIYPGVSRVRYNYIVQEGYNGVRVIDEKDNPTTTLTDVFGRTRVTIDALGGRTEYDYTNWDAPSEIRPPLGPKYDYGYDRRLLTSKTVPGGGTTSYVYDSKHRLAATQLSNGKIVGNTYDSYGRLFRSYLRESGGFPAPFTNFSPISSDDLLTEDLYVDPQGGGGNDIGRLEYSKVRILDDPGSLAETDYTYDSFGRLLSQVESINFNGANATITQSNNLYTHRDLPQGVGTTVELPGKRHDLSAILGYDNFGRVITNASGIEIWASGIDIPLGWAPWSASYFFDSHGQMTKKQFFQNPSGAFYGENYSYNGRGWLTSINDPAARGFDADFCGQPNGNVYQGGSVEEEVTFEELLDLISQGESVYVEGTNICPDTGGSGPGPGPGDNPIQEDCKEDIVDSHISININTGQPDNHPSPFVSPFARPDPPLFNGAQMLTDLETNLLSFNQGQGEEYIYLSRFYKLFTRDFTTGEVDTILMASEHAALISELENWASTNGFSVPDISIEYLYGYSEFLVGYINIYAADANIEFQEIRVKQSWSLNQYDYSVWPPSLTIINETRFKDLYFTNDNRRKIDCPPVAAKGSGSSPSSYVNGNQMPSFPFNFYEVTIEKGGNTRKEFLLPSEISGITDKYTIGTQYKVTSPDQTFRLEKASGSIVETGIPGLIDARSKTNDPLEKVEMPVGEDGKIVDEPGGESFCEPYQNPTCTEEEELEQLAQVDAMLDEIDPSTAAYPFTLTLIMLCNGETVWLPGEGTNLENAFPGEIYILDEIIANSPDDIFNIRRQVNDALFSMKLDYERNGNIKASTWKSTYHLRRKYDYTYDKLNRIESASYSILPSPGVPMPTYGEGYKADNFSYDALGNILSLTRYAQLTPNTDAVIIDDLKYKYHSSLNFGEAAIPNQPMNARPDVSRLLSVEENENTEPALQYGFAPGDAPASSTYSYDGAGNMTTDPYKALGITYNHLNLPEEIDGNKVIYDANGRKLLMEYADGTKRLYLAGMEFVDDKFESVNLGDGRIYAEEPDPTGLGGNSGNLVSLVPEYWHKDHLGNIRVSFADKNGDKLIQLLDDGSGNGSEVNQILDYYPFGLQHPGQLCAPEVEPENAYRYNGKELLDEVGLYDYGARYYDATVARFTGVDPISEEFASYSGYNYVLGNPVRLVDPDGKAPEDCCLRLVVGAVRVGRTYRTARRAGQAIKLGDAIAKEGASIKHDWSTLTGSGSTAGEKLGALSDLVLGTWFNEAKEGTSKAKEGVVKTEDTESDSRSAALGEAKEANGIPRSAQPDRVIRPGTEEGDEAGLDEERNVRQYEYTNSEGERISIREDRPVEYPDGGRQDPHFNSGKSGEKLRKHHYFPPRSGGN